MRGPSSALRALQGLLLFLSLGGTLSIAQQSPLIDAQRLLRQAFDEYPISKTTAEETCSRAIALINAAPEAAPAGKAVLMTLLELRARARWKKALVDESGASEDFTSLLRLDISYVPGVLTEKQTEAVGQDFKDLFLRVRKRVVGVLRLTGLPPDTQLSIDNKPFTSDPEAGVQLVIGQHEISASRPGYRKLLRRVTVVPDEPSVVELSLERDSAVIRVITSPPAVEVRLSGVHIGNTPDGPPTEDQIRRANARQLVDTKEQMSGVLQIRDLRVGQVDLEFRRDCFVAKPYPFKIQALEDYWLVVKLEPAKGRLIVDESGAEVFLNRVSLGRGRVDRMECEASYDLLVRSSYGRYEERIAIKPGKELKVEPKLRPVVSLLTAVGTPERYPDDFRVQLGQALAPLSDLVRFVAPSTAEEKLAGRDQDLSANWVSSLAPAVRRAQSKILAERIDVQALGEVSVLSVAPQRVVQLKVLTPDSWLPDQIGLNLDDGPGLRRILDSLRRPIELFVRTADLTVVDTSRDKGALVVDQFAPPGAPPALRRGDLIVSAGDTPIASAIAFDDFVSKRKRGEKVMLTVKDATGLSRPVGIEVRETPNLLGLFEEGLLPNILSIDLRRRLAESHDQAEKTVLRLNLAVALMRLERWAEAKLELDSVSLPDLPGVSGGTVKFLMGVCLDQVGHVDEANRSFEVAAGFRTARLTHGGAWIAELARQKLAGVGRPKR